MLKNNPKFNIIIKFLFIAIFISTIIYYPIDNSNAYTQYSNNINTKQSTEKVNFNINVSIKCKINIETTLIGVNGNIIRATRQAIYDNYCDLKKINNLNGYSINDDVQIFRIIPYGNPNTTKYWNVYFKSKKASSEDYNNISSVLIIKYPNGAYKGNITQEGIKDLDTIYSYKTIDKLPKNNETNKIEKYDINVSIESKIEIDASLKKIDNNIIKATRQAIYDSNYLSIRLNHYNISIDEPILINKVVPQGNSKNPSLWIVYYEITNKPNYNGVSNFFVSKLPNGSYQGIFKQTEPADLSITY
jgi:hypothetical protein